MTSKLYAVTVTQLSEGDFFFESPVTGISINGSETTLESAFHAAKEALHFTLSEYETDNLPPDITSTQLEELKVRGTHYQLISFTPSDIKTTTMEPSH